MVNQDPEERLPDWEAFYRDYRKPGYVAGFEITTKLGGGMFGLVFRARRMSIGKDYAIKFLQVDDETVRKAVLSELEQVKYFAQIDHPNLVSIEDRGEVDGIPFLVMAFAGTETLRDKMPAGLVPTAADKDELLRYFLQCCRGLAALHERSLVHFDIKPANVFLKGGVARLGDYGLSKLVTHSRGSLSMGRGTPYYMAPEMLQRRGDQRSDIYSLGVMLYELLCGKVPFTGDSEWEVLRKHETTAPELPTHLTSREVAVLQRCLQKDPAARFQSVHDLIAAFGVEGMGRVPGPTPQPRVDELPNCVLPRLPGSRRVVVPPPLPRRPAKWAVSVVVLCCVAGVFVVTMLSGRVAAGPRIATASTPVPVPVPQPASAGRRSANAANTNSKLEQLVAAAKKTLSTVTQRQRRTALQELDTDRYALPQDFRSYIEFVDALGKAPAFSSGQALKVERLGRAAFVAAITSLHDLDYDDSDDCRYAANLHRLLAQMTTISGLACEVCGSEPTELETCKFLAVADGWRRIAEQFAKNDVSYQQMLVAKGKVAGVER